MDDDHPGLRDAGQHERPGIQLSLGIGGAKADRAEIKVSGAIPLHTDVDKGDDLMVVVSTADGQVVAEAQAYVAGGGEKDKRNQHGDVIETVRGYQAKVDA